MFNREQICPSCGAEVKKGKCVDCKVVISALNNNSSNNICACCGSHKCRSISLVTNIYVDKFKNFPGQKECFLCFYCYEKERDKHFFISKNNWLTTKAKVLQNKFLQERQEALFYGESDEEALRKYQIACDYGMNINPHLWLQIGIEANPIG